MTVTTANSAAMPATISIFDGLPPGIPLDQAAEIKARDGDQDAKELLAHLKSREWRLREALLHAAFDAHPDWQRDNGGWLSRNAHPLNDHDQLIEWFQTNHPREARAIEASLS